MLKQCVFSCWSFMHINAFVCVCFCFLDVSGGIVLCLLRKGSVGELHEEHNNPAREAL